MDVDTALASVPVNKLPLVDDTDFKSIEDAVVYNQAGLALFWNFTTTAGVKTVTAVTPTTAGVYDWTDFTTSGMYGIEIPASGGASANNDTEGVGYFTGVATGILPWVGPTIGFRSAALNNALINGTDLLDVNSAEISDSVAAADALEEGAESIIYGTCGAGSTTTNVVSGLTTAADQFNGKVINFKRDTVTVALRGKSAKITDTDASGNLTIIAISTAAATGETFTIT